jgi:cysteine desulfurase
MKSKHYYFDYAASTPVDPEVEKAMKPFWSEVFGNPGALHSFGQKASAEIFKARKSVADILGCKYDEIIFTGSATEANNLALRGIARPKIIVSAIEHDSILDTARILEREGAEVAYLPVSKKGIVDLKKMEELLDERTVLVSVMYANNEVGTVQPIREISKIINNFRISNKTNKSVYPLLHTDAVQAFNYLPCKVDELGVDLMTLSSQKIYGPKGIGMLYVRSVKTAKTLEPLITGGGQEFGLRSGTENVPGIVGFAKAAALADKLRDKEVKRLSKLRDYFLTKAKKIIPSSQLNGDGENRLPNNINLYFPGEEAQELIIKLDLAGFAVSPGAACSARVCKPSHVLKAMGHSDERATHSIRITLGRGTNKKEIDLLLTALKKLSA